MRVKQEESSEEQALMAQQTRNQVFCSQKIEKGQYILVGQVKKQIIFRDNLDLFIKARRMTVMQKSIQAKNQNYCEQIPNMLNISELACYLNQDPNNSNKQKREQKLMIYRQVLQLTLSILQETNMEALIHMSSCCYRKFSQLNLQQILEYQRMLSYYRIVNSEKFQEFLITQELGREYIKQICKVILLIQEKKETIYRAQNIYYLFKQKKAIKIQQEGQTFRQEIIRFWKQGNSKKNQQIYYQSLIKNIQKHLNFIQGSYDKQIATKKLKIPFFIPQQQNKKKYSKTQKEKLSQSQEVNNCYENKSNSCQQSYYQITIKGLACKQQNNYKTKLSCQNNGINVGDNFDQKFLNINQDEKTSIQSVTNTNEYFHQKKFQRNYFTNCNHYFQQNAKSDQQIQSQIEQIQITQSKNIQNKDLETFNGQKYSFLVSKQNEKILGGGICGSGARVVPIKKTSKEQQIQQIMNEKQHLMQKFQVNSENDELDDTNLLQVKEFSDSIVDKLKNIASLIAQSHQFRYIKAQLLLFFAQILQTSNQSKGQFDEIMISVVSNYLQEKQKSVKIIYEGNQIMADFIHNHLDKKQILLQINQFKKQMTKHLNNEQEYNNFAYEIHNEITSRLEKITVSDAKVYFNYYDQHGNQGQNDSFAILKLEKITESDINDYFRLFKNQIKKNLQLSFNEFYYEKIQQTIFKNKQLLELLKLPINLYLTTRMMTDLDLNDQETLSIFEAATDQIEIQELFFQQQFKKQTKSFIEKQEKMVKKLDQEIVRNISSCYFEYFQSIAMKMFLQKGAKPNFLSITRDSVNFQLREEIQTFLKKNKIEIEELKQGILNYVDSRVITRVKLTFEDENTLINQEQKTVKDDQSPEFEFRHKSLFEYFAARAMKYDFDLHKEDIFKLDISQLRKFNINQKIIMSSLKNASEQQILLKLYKLLKPYLDSDSFKQTYSLSDIALTNRYIQFLKKSSIAKYTDKSEIDVGSSNLLSALFISKFSYPNLIFNKCSFTQAYISSHSRKVVEFQDCNFENSLIEKQYLDYFETSNTKNAMLSAFQKYFDTDNNYQFNQVIFHNNTLVTITKTGYVNQFELNHNTGQPCKILLSNQITNSCLNSIHYVNKKNIFVITANKSIFEIDPKTLERINCFTFQQAITSFSAHNQKYIITLANNQVHYGNFENSFTILDKTKIQADQSLFVNDLIITSLNNQIKVYNISDLSLLKTIDDSYDNFKISAFSADGKYLALSYQNESCQIFSTEKGFEAINLIEGHDLRASSITFSADGKYLAIGSQDYSCTIFNVEKGFELIQTIEGHVKPINSVSFSTDGKYLATSSLDNNCKIQNVENEFGLSHTIQGHINWINSVAFSAIGNHFATSSSDKTCKLWKIGEKIELIHVFNIYQQRIESVTFSNNGKLLAIGSFDGICNIWNIEKEFQLVSTIDADSLQIASLAFSADDKYLAMSLNYGTFKVLSVDNAFKVVNTTKGHNETITSVTFSADGKYLVTGSEDFTCKIWSVENEFKLVNTIQKHTETITQVTISADCKYLITCSQDITCQIFSIEKDFELINSISGHTQAITSVAFSKNGKYLATGSNDSTCNIWSVEKGFELINKIQEHTSSVISISFSADSKYLLTGSKDNTCKIWNIEKGFEFISPIQGHTQAITSVTFSKDGKYLVTGSKDKTYQVWNIQKGYELVTQILAHSSLITVVAFSADSKYLATGSEDNTCRIWNVEKRFELILTIDAHTRYISSVAFSPDNQYLITSSHDSAFIIWDIQKDFKLYKKIDALINDITSVAFSADGKYLAIGSESYKCRIWNASEGFKLIHTIQGPEFMIESIAFSADGKYLAAGYFDKVCKIWNVQKNFELIRTIEGHNQIITSVAFSADSKYLATCSNDKTCKIWSVEKQFELTNVIKSHKGNLTSVSFSADGKYLAIGSQDNTCKIISVERGFEILNKIQGETQEITSVAFSEDGKYLATGSEDKYCKIWNVEKGYTLIDEILESFRWIDKNTFQITIKQENNQFTITFKNHRIFEQVYEV
ncbi:hypothetical protein ABPG73_006186 [Tetrahymena malaccensis]